MTDLEWFNARELAAIAKERGLKSFPQTERGVQILAEREGWNSLPNSLCQKRAGARRWHDVPPHGAARHHADHHPRPCGKGAAASGQEVRRNTEAKKVAALPVTSLRFRQRMQMEARGEILVAIERYMTMNGMNSPRRAILEFVRAQDEQVERNAAKEKAEAGNALSARERLLLERPSLLCHPDGFSLLEETLRLANDRSGGAFKVSRATIYEWFAARDAVASRRSPGAYG